MDIKQEITRIKPMIDAYIEKIVPPKGNPQILYDGIRKYFEYGGKRIRPALIAFSCEMLGGKTEDTIPAGTAVEVLHTFFLIHDDIEDFSDIRRGQPALHKIYGIPQAINMGDYLFIKSYESLISGMNIWGIYKTNKVMELFSEMCLRTAEGQAYEMEYRDKPLSIVDYNAYENLAIKTGYYTGGSLLAMGAAIAGATDEQITLIKKLGYSVGVAFQVQDDILNLIMKEEDEKVAPGTKSGGVGKDFAGDIKEGKRTIIIVHAYQSATPEDKKILDELYGKMDITTEEKKKVIGIINKYKSIEYARDYGIELVKKSLEGIRANFPDNDGRKKLEAVGMYLITRKF